MLTYSLRYDTINGLNKGATDCLSTIFITGPSQAFLTLTHDVSTQHSTVKDFVFIMVVLLPGLEPGPADYLSLRGISPLLYH